MLALASLRPEQTDRGRHSTGGRSFGASVRGLAGVILSGPVVIYLVGQVAEGRRALAEPRRRG